MSDPKLDVKALRALLAAATPGPWRVYTETGDRAFGTLYVLDPTTKPNDGCAIASDICDPDGRSSHENAALIAAAVNALPALLDLAEGAGGLVFGSADGEGVRHAVSLDRETYGVRPTAHMGEPFTVRPWMWWQVASQDYDYADTESAAIEAARTHDRARRGSR